MVCGERKSWSHVNDVVDSCRLLLNDVGQLAAKSLRLFLDQITSDLGGRDALFFSPKTLSGTKMHPRLGTLVEPSPELRRLNRLVKYGYKSFVMLQDVHVIILQLEDHSNATIPRG